MRWKVRFQVRYASRIHVVLAALAIAAILGGLAGGLIWSPGRAVASTAQVEHPKRTQYYLTRDGFAGDQVLSACAMGFHTAALWEILDTSSLRYNTRLGHARSDSGHGPPVAGGWVRTGGASDSTDLAGEGNCQAWTSNSGLEFGSFVSLPGSWEAGNESMMAWTAGAHACSNLLRVWCVGNESVVYLPLVMRNWIG